LFGGAILFWMWGRISGLMLCPLARMVSHNGRVFAFEPQRLVFQNLCANLALNALTNVYAYEAGVGIESGWMRLPVFDPRQSFNFAAVSMEGHESGPLAQIMTIDDLKLTRCNLIKVDVEGMEIDVLAGAAATIERFRPVLFVENNMYGFLAESGYPWFFTSVPTD
jgi:FkbM family methyltransferase